MQLLDSLTIYYRDEPRHIELYHGDITATSGDPVDCLVVSAFPNDYSPVSGSLAGSLWDRGISLSALAANKAADLRESCSCWWSHVLTIATTPTRRILCFEPRVKGGAADSMGDVFQSLTTMILANPSVRKVAMPLLASGYQEGTVSELLPALMEAAVHWIEAGLPITRLLLVENSAIKAAEIKGAFSILKRQYSEGSQSGKRARHDVFISYCQKDCVSIDFMTGYLRNSNPSLRIFRDTHTFKPGAMWCQDLFDAIEHSRRVVAFLSPHYLNSRMCREEWNIAYLRQVSSGLAILFPILLSTTNLPTYVQAVQYEDCREADTSKLMAAADKILSGLPH